MTGGKTHTLTERRMAAVRALLREEPLLVGNRQAIRARLIDEHPRLFGALGRQRQSQVISDALAAHQCNLLEVRDGLAAVVAGVAEAHKDDPHIVLRAVEVTAKLYGLHRLTPKVQMEDFAAKLDAEAAAWPVVPENVIELPQAKEA